MLRISVTIRSPASKCSILLHPILISLANVICLFALLAALDYYFTDFTTSEQSEARHPAVHAFLFESFDNSLSRDTSGLLQATASQGERRLSLPPSSPFEELLDICLAIRYLDPENLSLRKPPVSYVTGHAPGENRGLDIQACSTSISSFSRPVEEASKSNPSYVCCKWRYTL